MKGWVVAETLRGVEYAKTLHRTWLGARWQCSRARSKDPMVRKALRDKGFIVLDSAIYRVRRPTTNELAQLRGWQ